MNPRSYKKLFCKLAALALLAGVMLAGGCSGQGAGASSEVSGQETADDGGIALQIVEPEEETVYVVSRSSTGMPLGAYGFQKEGNVLYAMKSDYSAGENHYYKEAIGNGQPTEGQPTEELMASSAIYGEVVKHSLDFCVSADGCLYFVLREGEDASQERYVLVKCAGGGRELGRSEITGQLKAALEEGEGFVNVAADSQGRIYIATNRHIYLYDGEGAYCGELAEAGRIVSVGRSRDGAVYYAKKDEGPAAGSGQELLMVDFEEKSAVPACQGFPEGIPGGTLEAGRNYDLIINDGESLYGYLGESRTAVRILKWSDSDVVGRDILSAWEGEGGEILALEAGPSSLGLIRLAPWDGSMALPEKEVITIGVPYSYIASMSMLIGLEKRIAEYNQMQGQYRVELKPYGDAQDEESGMRAMALEIAAGKGPDLVWWNLQSFPAWAKRGFLEDLNQYLENSELLAREDYLENALKVFTFDGKLTALPAYVALDTYYGCAGQIGEEEGRSLEDFMKLQERYPDLPLLYITRPIDVLWDFEEFIYSLVDRENGTCSFESEEFRNLLEFSKAVPVVEKQAGWGIRFQTGEDFLLDRLFASRIDDFLRLFLTGDITFIGWPTEEGNGSRICIRGLDYSLGMSSQSKRKEGAWAFLEYLHGTVVKEEYAEAIESRQSKDGFPARKEYLEQYIYGAVGREYSDGESGYAMTREDADRIIRLLEEAAPSGIQTHSFDIMLIIQEEAEAYFAGDKSVEETMNVIQSRIGLYLGEQS